MLAEPDINLLSNLHFVANKRRLRGQWGERRSTRRGEGIEFTDFRHYTPGDDPRSVDWNLYARLDRPYIRLFEEEEDLVTAVLIDGSRSMGWAGSSISRWLPVQQIAAALGGIALMHGETLYGGLLQTVGKRMVWGPYRGRDFFISWQKWLDTLHPNSDVRLDWSLDKNCLHTKRPALVFILTDGYDIDKLQRGTVVLSAHGHEVILLQVLTPDELKPSLHGDLRLIDTESGIQREVNVDAATLAVYRGKKDKWFQDLRSIIAKYQGRYVLLRADSPLRRILLDDLRHANVLR
jgi:hypothetical protein